MWKDPLHLIVSSPTSYGISGPAAALIVASGIPIGFILYQIYFAFYGEVLPLLDVVAADRGAEVLASLSEDTIRKITSLSGCVPDYNDMYYTVKPRDQLPSVERDTLRSIYKASWRIFCFLFPSTLRLQKDFRNKAGRLRYKRRRIANLSLARAYLDQISSTIKSDHVEISYTSLSDIYHSLGACRTSLFLAFLCYMFYNLTWHHSRLLNQWQWFAGVVAINFIVLFFFLRTLAITRRNSYYSSQDVLIYSLNWFSKRHDPGSPLNSDQ
jgi:hypothetical protein